jgi:hypothetical protein
MALQYFVATDNQATGLGTALWLTDRTDASSFTTATAAGIAESRRRLHPDHPDRRHPDQLRRRAHPA